MPNHVHLVMVPADEDGLRSVLGETHRRYTRHVNFSKGWRGHLWQERFHSFVMGEEYLLSAVRYVENNPVAARLCKHAEDWKWSSAAAHIEGRGNGIVCVEPMLDRIPDWRDYLSGADGEDKSKLLRRHSRTGRPLGDEPFIRELEAKTGKVLVLRKPGRKPGRRK